MACSRFHLTPDDFWHNITPIELGYMFESYNEEKENSNRFDLEVMRLQTMILVNINLKPVNQFKDPKKFMSFYWEKEEQIIVDIPTVENWQNIDKLLGGN